MRQNHIDLRVKLKLLNKTQTACHDPVCLSILPTLTVSPYLPPCWDTPSSSWEVCFSFCFSVPNYPLNVSSQHGNLIITSRKVSWLTMTELAVSMTLYDDFPFNFSSIKLSLRWIIHNLTPSYQNSAYIACLRNTGWLYRWMSLTRQKNRWTDKSTPGSTYRS